MPRKNVGPLKDKQLNRVEDAIGEPMTDAAWNALSCLTLGELGSVAHWLDLAKSSLVSRTLAAERGEVDPDMGKDLNDDYEPQGGGAA